MDSKQTELKRTDENIIERTYINWTHRRKKENTIRPLLMIFKHSLNKTPAKDQEAIEVIEKEKYEEREKRRI